MKKKVGILVVLSLLVIPSWSLAHFISEEMDQCMEKDPSTSGQLECMEIAFDKWDEELNRVYTILMTNLDTESKEALQESQRRWIKFRDSELNFLGCYYENFSGTMYVPMQAYSELKITKERALKLHAYLNFIEEHLWYQ